MQRLILRETKICWKNHMVIILIFGSLMELKRTKNFFDVLITYNENNKSNTKMSRYKTNANLCMHWNLHVQMQ